MAAKDDFFVTFGSNAKTFSERLIRELAPARAEIESLNGLLGSLDRAGTHAGRPHLPPPVNPPTPPSGGGSRQVLPDMTKTFEALSQFQHDIRDVSRELATLALGLKQTQGQVGRMARGEGSWMSPKGGTITAEEAARTVGAYRMGQTPIDPALLKVLQGVAAGGSGGSSSDARIPAVSKVELDTAALDRVVKAVNEVRDEIADWRKQGARPGDERARPNTTGTTPPTTSTARSGTAHSPAPTAADSEEAQLARLQTKISKLEVLRQQMVGVMAHGGSAIADSVQAQVDALDTELTAAKAAQRQAEREITGVTRSQQKARNKADFAALPDLPEQEYDSRVRLRQRLDQALNPEQFRAAVGRKSGQLGRDDLTEMADKLTKMGFSTPYSTRTKVPDLTERVISGRQAMLAQYGSETPPELQTGRKLVADKVGDSVKQLIHAVNISAEEAAQEQAAREVMRLHGLVGHKPLDPTERGLAQGAGTRLAGQALSGNINVPPGMVKGGDFNPDALLLHHYDPKNPSGVGPQRDRPTFDQAIALLRDRALGRAANLMGQHPDYNPFTVKLHEEVKGSGAEAEQARIVFRAIRQAVNELDQLGHEFKIFSDAIEENKAFIARAADRRARADAGQELQPYEVTKLQTDPEKVAQANQQIEHLQAQMASSRFKALQQTFEDPAYQAGREARAASRQTYNQVIQGNAARQTYIGDAAGQALVGSRLAPGTRDTFIRNIPGMGYDPHKDSITFADMYRDRDPAQLTEMNKAWNRTQSGLRREQAMAQDVAAGTRPQEDLDRLRRRTENAATSFLNQMQEIFKISRPLEELIGRTRPGGANALDPLTGHQAFLTPQKLAQMGLTGIHGPSLALPDTDYNFVNPANAASDARRQRATAANTLEHSGSTGASPEELLAQRLASVDATLAEYTKAQRAHATQEARVAKVEEVHEAAIQARIKALDAASRAAYDAAKVDEEAASAERKALGSTSYNMTPSSATNLMKKNLAAEAAAVSAAQTKLTGPALEQAREWIAGRGMGNTKGRGREIGSALTELIATAPATDQELYRGTRDRKLKPGDEFTYDTPASFSAHARGAEPFALEQVLEKGGAILKVLGGAHALDLSGASIGKEQELLAGGRFRVKAVEEQALMEGADHPMAGTKVPVYVLEQVEAFGSKVKEAGDDLAGLGQKAKKDDRLGRDPVTGAFRDPRLRDELGYDAYGYSPAKVLPNGAGRIEETTSLMGYGPSEAEANTIRNKEASKVASAKEADARERVAAILGVEAKELTAAQHEEQRLRQEAHKASIAYNDLVKNLHAQMLVTAEGRVESRRQSIRELERVGAPDTDVQAAVKKRQEAESELARVQALSPSDLLAELRTKASTQRAGGGVGTNAPSAQARVTADSAEANALRARLREAERIQRELKKVQDLHKQAEGAEKAALAAQIKDLKALPGFAYKKEGQGGADSIQGMRKQITAMDREAAAAAAGGGSAGGGLPPTSNAGGRGGGAGGGGGFNDATNKILREILTAVNGIHKSIQAGVKISGGKSVTVDENGVIQTRKTRAQKPLDTFFPGPQAAGVDPGDARAEAEAAAAQERAAQEIKARSSAMARIQKEAIALNRQSDADARRNANITAAQAHEKLQLESAMAKLDATAIEELRILRELNAASASGTEIANQQARAVATVERALQKEGVAGQARASMGRSLLNNTQAPGQPDISASSYGQMKKSADAMFGPTLATSMKQAGEDGRSALAESMFGNKGFWGRIMSSTGTFIVRQFTASFVFGMANALGEIVHQGIITESTWIRVSDALDQTDRTAGNLRTQLQGISSAYGTQLNDVYDVAAGLTGMFQNIDDIAGATRVVSQLQAISDGALNAQEAMGTLASITGAYGDQLGSGVDGLQNVADVLTLIQNVIGSNVEVTSEGLGRMAGLSQQLKISWQDSAVYVAQIAKLTNQSGGAAGEQFSRILASMQSGKGRAAIERTMPHSGVADALNSGNFGAGLKLLLQNWDGLSSAQKRNLTVSLAGQRQAAAFAALMNNSAKVLDTVARAHNADGEAAQRAAAIAHTLNGQISRLTSNLQNLAQNLIRTGLLNVAGIALQAINGLLSGVNNLFSRFNDFTDGNPFLKFLKEIGVGIVGLMLALSLANKAFVGFKATMAGMRANPESALGAGLNAASASGPGVLNVRENMRTIGDRGSAALTGKAVSLEAKAAEADAAMASRGRIVALRSEALAARAAAGTTSLVGKGLKGIANAGLAANLGMIGVVAMIATIVDSFKQDSDFAKSVKDYTDTFDPKTGGNLSPSQQPYIGPANELVQQRAQETSGMFNMAKFVLGQGVKFLDPATWDDPGNTGTLNHQIDAWQGVLTKHMRTTLEKLDESVSAALDEVNNGGLDNPVRLYWNQWTKGGKVPLGGPGGGAGVGSMLTYGLKDHQQQTEDGTGLPHFGLKHYTVAEVRDKAIEQNDRINARRQEIIDDKTLTAAQRASALAYIEALAKKTNDKVASMILFAKGLKNIDVLSMDQVDQLDELTGLFQNTQGSGIGLGGQSSGSLRVLISNLGVRKKSVVGQALTKLAGGNLTAVQALGQDRKIIEQQVKNLNAKYLAATTGSTALDPAEQDQIRQKLEAKIQQLAQNTNDIIQGFVDTSTTIAQAAAAAGDYTGAANTLDQGLNTAHARRPAHEPADVKARRDLVEVQGAETAAGYRSTLMNEQLQASAAQSMDAVKNAQTQVQINRNTYTALLAEQARAQQAGRMGPSIQAINDAKIAWLQSETSAAQTTIQTNGAILQAQAALAGAYATARGDTIAATRDQIRGAQSALNTARQMGDKAGVINAQAQIVGLNAQLDQNQQDLIQSRIGVAVAIATAAGNSVEAAKQQLRGARILLAHALRKSGGQNNAEINNLRASAIQAHAAVRDAALQDRLDTIDFNLQMGRITQSSAIAALREILRTRDLTKQQRRQLLLEIKGMQDQMANDQWNFGDIKLPTPYQMRRYVEQRKASMNAALDAGLRNGQDRGGVLPGNNEPRTHLTNSTTVTHVNHTNIRINGADVGAVKRIIREVVGGNPNTRTIQGRRR